MKAKISFIALMLCLYSTGYAQVEQTAKEMAESEHQRFANELPDALSKGRTGIFELAGTERKQFLLEENANTFSEILGWNIRQYNHKTLSSVLKALSGKSNPVDVTVDFPVTPSESNVSIKTDSKGTVASYTVTTKATVTVEANKQGAKPSIAKNTVALIWEGKLPLVNGEVNNSKKIAKPVLRSIKTAVYEPPKPQMQAKVEELTEDKEPVIVAAPVPEVVKPVEEPVTESKPVLLPVEPTAEPVVEQPVARPVEPPVKTATKPVSQPDGSYYKIQIMSIDFYKPIAELSPKFRVDGLVVEKYRNDYKYVVPAGTTMKEALAKQRQLAEKGLDQTWIVVYENGARVRPPEGKPESLIE